LSSSSVSDCSRQASTPCRNFILDHSKRIGARSRLRKSRWLFSIQTKGSLRLFWRLLSARSTASSNSYQHPGVRNFYSGQIVIRPCFEAGSVIAGNLQCSHLLRGGTESGHAVMVERVETLVAEPHGIARDLIRSRSFAQPAPPRPGRGLPPSRFAPT